MGLDGFSFCAGTAFYIGFVPTLTALMMRVRPGKVSLSHYLISTRISTHLWASGVNFSMKVL
jgi:hypothetical protein